MKRLDSIDILRALAILFMIQVHFVLNLTPHEGGLFWLLYRVLKIGYLAAPIFTFLVGMSFMISWERRPQNHGRSFDQARLVLKRGALIFMLGLALSALLWGYESIFIWDILTFIGAAIILLVVLKQLSVSVLFALLCCVIGTSPLIRAWADYPSYWVTGFGQFNAGFEPRRILTGFLATGYFPVMPWIVFPIAGMITARTTVLSEHPAGLRYCLLVGCACLVAGFGSWRFIPFQMYPATLTYILMTLGGILVAFSILRRYVDLGQTSPAWMGFFRLYSRYSLTTYVLHLLLVVGVMRIVGFVAVGDSYAYYEAAFSTEVGQILAVAFIIAFYGVLVVWDKAGGKYSLEWGMRQLTKRP